MFVAAARGCEMFGLASELVGRCFPAHVADVLLLAVMGFFFFFFAPRSDLQFLH